MQRCRWWLKLTACFIGPEEQKTYNSVGALSPFLRKSARIGLYRKNPLFYLSEIKISQITAGTGIPLSPIKLLYFLYKAQGIALRINTIQS